MRNNKGQFGKGNPGKPKGAKNKKTTAMQQELIGLWKDSGGFEALFKEIKEIKDPYAKVQAKLKIVEYFMPKLKSVDSTVTIEDNNKPRTPEEIKADLDALNGE